MQLTGIAVLDLALYLAAALALALRLLGRGPLFVWERRGFALSAAAAAVLLHGIALYGLMTTPLGLNLGFFNALALAGWLAAAIGLAVAGLLKPGFDSLGIVLFPLAGTSVLLAETLPADVLLLPAQGWPLYAHILVSLLAYGLLSVAALQAIVLAVQDHRLRRGAAGGISSGIPPLQDM